jgi:hypothetical protein
MFSTIQAKKYRLAFSLQPLPGDGGRIFNEPPFISFFCMLLRAKMWHRISGSVIAGNWRVRMWLAQGWNMAL